jgi:hypothetical protein
MPSTTIEPAAVDVLAATPATLRALLGGLPQALVEAPADDDWSPRDVVAHLLSRAPVQAERVRVMLDADRPRLADVPEREQLERSGLRSRPLGELLDEFERLRAEDMRRLRDIRPEQAARTGQHEVAGEISVADAIHHHAYHDLLHIAQVATMLQDRLDPLRGNMQAF